MNNLTVALALAIQVSGASMGQHNPPLRLVTKISAPGMTGTWDHLTGDAAGKRMFVSAQEDQVVWVFDLNTNQPIHKITANFNRPQGLFYIPAGYLFVSNGRDGTLKVVDGHTFELVKSIPLTLGADMMDFDPRTRHIYVDHGGKDSNRGPGALAVIDTSNMEKIGDIVTDWRPGAVELGKTGSRLFVSLPGANQIGVIDPNAQKFFARLPIEAPARPVALALDEAHHRIFVGTRTPDKFFALDTDSGKTIAALNSVGGISGMFFDATHQRVYVSGLDGIVEIYQQVDPEHYNSLGRITIVPKAGTSLFMPSLNRYYVAAPPQGDGPGEIWVYEPLP
jgi:DNA-binding beta-propeller fold protein YncE